MTYFEPGKRERFSVGRLQLRSDQNQSWQLKVRTDFLNGEKKGAKSKVPVKAGME